MTPIWIEHLAAQYGARQAASLRGDLVNARASNFWLCEIASDHWHEIIAALRHNPDEATQTREAKLREAPTLTGSCQSKVSGDVVDIAQKALATPIDDTALQERLAAERERCAKVCEQYSEPVFGGNVCAGAIRSMK